MSPAYTVLIPKEKSDPVFFSYLFKTNEMLHKFTVMSQGLASDVWTLKFPLLKDIECFIPPSLPEQQKIGSFFARLARLARLDRLIALQRRKAEKLIQLKKGFLQKMFAS